MTLTLGNVQETMLIPLTIRANESLRPNPRINDQRAVEITRLLSIDLSKYNGFMSHEGVVSRTILFDHTVKNYLKKYPDATCINLGCGLDDRFTRVDNGQIHWYNVDLPDAIAARKQFFTETEREHFVSGSILEAFYTADIPKDKMVIIIAEGLFMYFTLEQIRHILAIIQLAFPHFILLAEMNHPIMAKNTKHHDTVKYTNAVFQSGTKSGKELELLCPDIHLISEISFNEIMRRHSFRGWLFGTLPFLRSFNDRLAIYHNF